MTPLARLMIFGAGFGIIAAFPQAEEAPRLFAECGVMGAAGSLPWHALVYQKSRSYKHICAGSLVTPNVVISAAQCFTNGREVRPVSDYAVALGKTHQLWNYTEDQDTQTSDIADIKVPQRYSGASTNFAHDISLLFLTRTLVITSTVTPVCVSFDMILELEQFKLANIGKAAVAFENGTEPATLQVASLSHEYMAVCIAEGPPPFDPYITYDKVCFKGSKDERLCALDSGSGVAFPASDRGTVRYFLRGVGSYRHDPSDWPSQTCTSRAFGYITSVIVKQEFIKKFL